MKKGAKARTRRHRPHAEWKEFVHRHRGNPFLQHDSLYALSECIIDKIKAEAPAFFTEDQERFELDLVETASFGFFHGRALGLTVGDTQADPKTGLSLQDRYERSTREIDEMIADELRCDGLAEWEIHEYFQQDADTHKVINIRQDAYAGWLISNRQFHEEVGKLRGSWENRVRKAGVFPAYPRLPFFGDTGGIGARDPFRKECFDLYRRWGLYRMLTWDWPVPMAPDLIGTKLMDPHLLADAGVVLFVPWYLLRGERLNLQGVVQRARSACEKKHLRNWLRKQSGQSRDEMGDFRYEHLQWIYRYHELVLVRRYGPACKGHVQRLDRALATVIKKEVDTVKKARLALRRALHGDAND